MEYITLIVFIGLLLFCIYYFTIVCFRCVFIYDISPILVHLIEYRHSFGHFLTNLCAIVGGVFTVAGMIDGALYHGGRVIKKKMELGKLS
jgi:hypothetical protein